MINRTADRPLPETLPPLERPAVLAAQDQLTRLRALAHKASSAAWSLEASLHYVRAATNDAEIILALAGVGTAKRIAADFIEQLREGKY